MILLWDASGRPVRRAFGFRADLVVDKPGGPVPTADAVGGAMVEGADLEPGEEGEPATTTCTQGTK
jgi:hypothetical protein